MRRKLLMLVATFLLFIPMAQAQNRSKQPTIDKETCAKIAARPDPFAQFGGISNDNAICKEAYPDLYQDTAKKDEDVFIWGSSGASLLHHCDETDTSFSALSLATRQSWIFTCDFWVLGISQGVGMLQQIRPLPPDKPISQRTPEEEKLAESEHAYAESFDKLMRSFGLTDSGKWTVPYGDMCPGTASADELRRVVIKWIKDHPTQLTQEGAILAFTALENTYHTPKETNVGCP